MLSRPASPPAGDRAPTEFSDVPDGRAHDTELSRRVEREQLRSRLVLMRREREALRERIGELETRLQTKEEQLDLVSTRLERKERQLQGIIDRYESVIEDLERSNGRTDTDATGGTSSAFRGGIEEIARRLVPERVR